MTRKRTEVDFMQDSALRNLANLQIMGLAEEEELCDTLRWIEQRYLDDCRSIVQIHDFEERSRSYEMARMRRYRSMNVTVLDCLGRNSAKMHQMLNAAHIERHTKPRLQDHTHNIPLMIELPI